MLRAIPGRDADTIHFKNASWGLAERVVESTLLHIAVLIAVLRDQRAGAAAAWTPVWFELLFTFGVGARLRGRRILPTALPYRFHI